MKFIEILESIIHDDYGFTTSNNPMERYGEDPWEGYNGKLSLNNETIGSINFIRFRETDKWFVNGFYIKEKFKGKKLGSLLMQKMLEFAKSKNIKHITLSVYSDNEAAINTYKKFGFMFTGQDGNISYMELKY